METMEKYITDSVARSAEIKELDAQINGPLVEIANVIGYPIFARFSPSDDMYTIESRTEALRSIIKDVTFADFTED